MIVWKHVLYMAAHGFICVFLCVKTVVINDENRVSVYMQRVWMCSMCTAADSFQQRPFIAALRALLKFPSFYRLEGWNENPLNQALFFFFSIFGLTVATSILKVKTKAPLISGNVLKIQKQLGCTLLPGNSPMPTVLFFFLFFLCSTWSSVFLSLSSRGLTKVSEVLRIFQSW